MKTPSTLVTHVGDTITWTLSGIHNRTGNEATAFTIVDMPGVGLNFVSGSLPAFTHGQGVTYDIRYRVAGSNQWRTLVQGINAASPFYFELPQPGNLHYTDIRFDFGTVPVNFGLGNEIILRFVVGDNAPNNTLVNHFIVGYSGNNSQGESPHTPVVVPPPFVNGGGTVTIVDDLMDMDGGNIPLGFMPQTGNEAWVYWIGSAISFALISGLASMIFMKANKNKIRPKK